MSEFKHGLNDKFINQLTEEANKTSWWADVLDDRQLFVAVRDRYLNVYWRGHSLFEVEEGEQGLKATTHPKYLMDPELADRVLLEGGKFNVSWLVDHGFITEYRSGETLKKMKKASDLFSEPEKRGCHEIILANPHVIDCEIAFPGNGGPDKGAPRVDLLSLELEGKTARLVFWEAKHFSNDDLRAKKEEDVVVCKQIGLYRQYLSQHRKAIEESYTLVAKNLVDIDAMRRQPRLPPQSPIRAVADGKRKLTLGEEPKVGLVIFGFDKAQRDDRNWKDHHLKRLKKHVDPVRAAGDAKHILLKL
jgi:hypothetical protein